MRIKNIILSSLSTLVVISTLLLSGCGGGSGTAGTGTAPSGLTSGTITGITSAGGSQVTGMAVKAPTGSIAINGVQYNVASASITMDNDDPEDNQLKVGMVVHVRGDDDGKKGDAREIEYEDLLKGPVAAIDAAGNKLTVLGQTVLVDSTTVFGNVSGLSGLAGGDMVKVSGLPGDGGVILATRIDKKTYSFTANKTPVKLRGIVESVNGQSFTVGTLQITSSKPLPAGLATGSYVKVKGTLADLSGPLAATGVDVKRADVEPDDGQIVRLQGMVANFVSLASFKVNGVAVDASGTTATGIANNVKVLVEGKMVNGVLVANNVTILSTPAPIPTPIPTPTPNPNPSPTPDGAALYDANCATCHSLLASSSKKGATAAQIQSRMAAPPFATRVLTAAEVQAIANALAVTPIPTPTPAPTPAPTPTPTPAPLPGKAIYDANCAGCHKLGTYDTAGSAPDLSGSGSLVSTKFPGHMGITLTSTQISDIAAFLNAN